MKHVLIVNQSAELYGSDKAILELIEHFPEGYVPIVVLHQEGPLKILLEKKGIQVIRASVIKIRRGIFTVPYLLQLPFEIIGALRTIRKELNGTKIDLVHSNAISVFIGAFYSFVFRIKHLWHVHEIIEHPALAAKAYPRIVPFFADLVVFNSNSSYDQFYKFNKKIGSKSLIIHNGQERIVPISTPETADTIRSRFFKADGNCVVIGLVGRISRLKGQKVLLEAFRLLAGNHPEIRLAYIGAPPDDQPHFLTDLEEMITGYKLGNRVSITPFQENIWPFYDAIDIVIVPSTEPESFGLVATEGMLSQKPVVASNLGGLREIVKDGETGFIFEAGNASDLSLKIEKLLQSEELRKRFGENGLQRVQSLFGSERFVASFTSTYHTLTS